MSEQYDRLKTALADRYTIERQIGVGGMATVYLAHDVKHDRKVAVKVMRAEIAAALGSDRFLREIRLAAKLQHPHILMLIESGEADGILYYVMPFVDGESLAARMEREKQLPLEDSVSIALDVAGALSYAHEQNVIHRDIKPDNILLSGGHAVVMDFGIGRAISAAGGDKLTETGLVVGTPAYMSPEQFSGSGDLDGRTDVYALGCVLYEMLSGEPPYTGVTPQSILAKSLADPVPSARRLRETISPALDAAIRMALAKVPADRFATAKAFAEALVADTPVTPTVETPMPFPSPVRWRRRIGYAGSGVAALVLVWALFFRGGNARPAGDMTGTTIRRLTSFVGWETSPSWSPDGSQITYSHIVGGDADVATLSLGGGDPHILTADSPADEWNPRWSPDGSKIAFVSDRGAGSNIYWIPPTGGSERMVAETNIPFLEQMFTWDGSFGANPWSPDGQELVFSRLHETGETALWTVNLSTGEETQLTTPAPGVEDGQASWSFDGEQVAFTRNNNGVPSVWLLPAEGGEPSLVVDGGGVDMMPAWFPDNERLAFLSFRSGALNVWEIELSTSGLRQLTSGGSGLHYKPSVAPNGSIAYVEFDHQIDIYWLPLEPDQDQERITSFTGENFAPRLSQDGNRVVYHATRTGNYDLWLYDRTTEQHRLLTEDPAADRMPDWSPDGEQVVFLSNRAGAVTLWVVETATGVTRQLSDHELPWSWHQGDTQAGPRWSPDGSVIGYLAKAQAGTAIWLVNPDGSNRRPSAVRDAFSFDWYKDGQRVIYTRRAPDRSGAVELRAAHLGTGEDVLLQAGAISEVSVSPDGSALTFISSVSHFTMELQLQRLAPTTASNQLPSTVGDPQQITFGNGEWHVHGGGWAWDGSGLVYSRDADRGDIYLIEPTR